MTELVEVTEQPILPADIDLDAVEEYMLQFPQVECPVEHHFGPGVCIRERLMPANSFILGHKHKKPNLCMIVQGHCMVYSNGEMQEIMAPHLFVAEPARKVIYTFQDTVWINVFQTDLTDIDEIEREFIEISPAYQKHRALTQEAA